MRTLQTTDHVYKGHKYSVHLVANDEGHWFELSVPTMGTLDGFKSYERWKVNELYRQYIDRVYPPEGPIEPQDGDFFIHEGKPRVIDQFNYTCFGDKDTMHLLMGGGSCFFGPGTAYSPNQNRMLSISGGPFESVVKPKSFRLVGRQALRTWQWRETPQASGGIHFEIETNVWEASE